MKEVRVREQRARFGRLGERALRRTGFALALGILIGLAGPRAWAESPSEAFTRALAGGDPGKLQVKVQLELYPAGSAKPLKIKPSPSRGVGAGEGFALRVIATKDVYVWLYHLDAKKAADTPSVGGGEGAAPSVTWVKPVLKTPLSGDLRRAPAGGTILLKQPSERPLPRGSCDTEEGASSTWRVYFTHTEAAPVFAVDPAQVAFRGDWLPEGDDFAGYWRLSRPAEGRAPPFLQISLPCDPPSGAAADP